MFVPFRKFIVYRTWDMCEILHEVAINKLSELHGITTQKKLKICTRLWRDVWSGLFKRTLHIAVCSSS
jgi:hypothetical protein